MSSDGSLISISFPSGEDLLQAGIFAICVPWAYAGLLNVNPIPIPGDGVVNIGRTVPVHEGIIAIALIVAMVYFSSRWKGLFKSN